MIRVDADLSWLKPMSLIELARLAVVLERDQGETSRRHRFRVVEQKRADTLALESRRDKDLIEVAIDLVQDEKTNHLAGTFRDPDTVTGAHLGLKAFSPFGVGPRGEIREVVMPRIIPEAHSGFEIVGMVETQVNGHR